MNNSFTLRKASFADEDELLKIIEPLRGPAFNWTTDSFLSEFQQAETWLLCQGSQIVAFACLRDVDPAWELSVLATRKEFQGQGAMEQLLSSLSNTHGQERELWLEVHENNLAARNLYQKLGFISQRTRLSYYSDGASAILFSKPRSVKPL